MVEQFGWCRPIAGPVRARTCGAVLAALLTAGCGGSSTPMYTIGGGVSGLAGSGLVLQNNGSDGLTVSTNGPFTFKTASGGGAAYNVTVATQPSNPVQSCTTTNGAGNVASADVTNVTVSCMTLYSVGGTATGVAGAGLVLQLNGANDLAVSANGTFLFSNYLPTGTSYTITVKTQPSNPAQICSLDVALGIIGTTNVTTPVVTCKTLRTIGGTLQGLSLSRFTTGIVLQDNSGDDLTVSDNGAFTFGTTIPDGDTFNVTLEGQPTLPPQTCTVSNASGTASGGDVTSVSIACSANAARFVAIANTIGTVNLYGVQPGGGTIQPLETFTAVHGGLTAIAADPSGQFVYTASSIGYLEGSRIDPVAGTLAQLSGSPYIDHNTPAAISIDPTGRFLYTANTYGGATSQGSVSAFTIDPHTGALAEIPGSPYTVNFSPTSLAVDASGHFLYAPSQSGIGGQIHVTGYSIDQATGALTPLTGSPFSIAGGLPRAAAVQDGYLFVENAAYNPYVSSPTIAGFSLNPTTGALTPVTGATNVLDAPFGLASSPLSGFLYGTSFSLGMNPGSISAYATDAATGILSPVIGSPFQDTPFPTAIAVDPLSKYVFVASELGGSNPQDGAIYVYAIDGTTGALYNKQGPYGAGDYPYAIVVF